MPAMRMPFGKHKHQPLDRVKADTSYVDGVDHPDFLFTVAKSKRMIESRGEKQPEGGDSEPARNAVAGAEAHERAPAAASQECPRLPRSPTTSITRDNPAPVDALGRGLGRPAGSEGVMHRLASLEDPLRRAACGHLAADTSLRN
jgi:hypothetical protein